MNLEIVADLLKKKHLADHVEFGPDFLEVELTHALPKERSADGKNPVLLRIEFMIRREAGLIPGHIYETELRQPTQLFEWRDRTKDYENNSEVQKLYGSIRDETEALKTASKTTIFSVTTADGSLPFEIIDAKTTEQSKRIGEGAKIRFLSATIHEAVAFPETYTFLLSFARDTALAILAGIVANYLYDKLKSKADAKLKIKDADVPVDKDEIERAILRYVA